MPNINSNGYTIGFAAIFVALLAILLAGLAEATKERAEANKTLDKQMSILKSEDKSILKSDAAAIFESSVTSYLVKNNGESEKVDGKTALDLDLKKELKKSDAERLVPIFVYNKENEKRYILPLRGNGLWDEIWGFMALKEDYNTISGVSFDHAGETPGLGAEITKAWFQENFDGEKIFNEQGEFVGIDVLKGKNNPKNKNMHMVDGISGSTITGDGVEDMIQKCVKGYLPYFDKQKVGTGLSMK